MRRTQSVRNRSMHHVTVSDDLGALREAGDQSIEDVLRQELATARRENDKLQGQIESLNAALRTRPPIERVQELEKEFSSLELLLHGTQRENERAMAELERIKNREKVMERELRKFAGDDWEDTLNLNTIVSGLPAVRSIGTTLARITATDTPSSLLTASSSTATEQTLSTTEATLAHMEQIRTMLLGMTERLQSGEDKLNQAMDKAEKEKKQLEDLASPEDPYPKKRNNPR